MTPALYVPITSGIDNPRWMNIHPNVCRYGWDNFLGDVAQLVDEFKIKEVMLRECYGLVYVRKTDGTPMKTLDTNGKEQFLRRQDLNAYNEALTLGTVPDPVFDSDAFRTGVDMIRSKGAVVSAYVGPYWTHREPSAEDIRDMLEPYVGVIDLIYFDGAGSWFTKSFKEKVEANGFRMGIEPLAETTCQDHDVARSLPSLTTDYALLRPDGFAQPYTEHYTSPRMWLDITEQDFRSSLYWEKFDRAVAEGFYPMLPYVRSVWKVWRQRLNDPSR